MSKTAKIRKEITEILNNLLEAKNSFYYSEYLFYPKSREEKQYINSSVEFQFFRKILWKYSVIELSKIFKEKEKGSIFKFINKLRPGGEFQKVVSNELIQKWDLKLKKIEPLINKVTELRDSVFAHSDKSFKETLNSNTIILEVEDLILFTHEFIKDIFLHTLGATIVLPSKFLKKEFNVIKILAETNKY